jgi:hypothetical protein
MKYLDTTVPKRMFSVRSVLDGEIVLAVRGHRYWSIIAFTIQRKRMCSCVYSDLSGASHQANPREVELFVYHSIRHRRRRDVVEQLPRHSLSTGIECAVLPD